MGGKSLPNPQKKNMSTPRRFLEINVLDDERLVSCEEVGGSFGLRLEEAREEVERFAHANAERVFLYRSGVERPSSANGGVMRIHVTGNATSPAQMQSYAVAPIAWRTLHGAAPPPCSVQPGAPSCEPLISLPQGFAQPGVNTISKRAKVQTGKRKAERQNARDEIVIDEGQDDAMDVDAEAAVIVLE